MGRVLFLILLFASQAFSITPVNVSDCSDEILLNRPIAPLPGYIDAVVTLIWKDHRLLMGERFGGAGSGTWGFIGGKLDPGETIAQAARRETREEVGLALGQLRWISTAFDYRPELNQHFRVFFLSADSYEGIPEILEKDKITRLGWFCPGDLPSPIFSSNLDFVQTYLASQNSGSLGNSRISP